MRGPYSFLFWIPILLIVAVNGFSSPVERDRLTIDFEMVEKGLEWLELIRSGEEDSRIKGFFMREVAPTRGCRAVIHHWARFREWNEEILLTFILEALGRAPTDQKLENPDGTPTMFSHRRRLWQGALQGIEGMRRDLKRLKSADLRSSLAIARAALPENVVIKADFSFVLFGHSNAFSVGEENGFDFLQLPRREGVIAFDELIGTFAHELHHSGFSWLSRRNLAGIDQERIYLPALLAAEGMPTYFIDQPWKRIRRLKSNSDPLRQQVALDWERHSGRIRELYREAERDIQSGLAGSLEPTAILKNWMAGAKGPAYVLGADMFSVIDAYLGRETALRVASDFRKLLRFYNFAAEKANTAGMALHVFDQGLVRRLAGFDGR